MPCPMISTGGGSLGDLRGRSWTRDLYDTSGCAALWRCAYGHRPALLLVSEGINVRSTCAPSGSLGHVEPRLQQLSMARNSYDYACESALLGLARLRRQVCDGVARRNSAPLSEYCGH